MLIPLQYSKAKALFNRDQAIIVKPAHLDHVLDEKANLILKKGVTVRRWDERIIEAYRESFGIKVSLEFYLEPRDVLIVWNGNGYIIKELNNGNILNLGENLKEKGVCRFVNSRLLHVVNRDSLSPVIKKNLAI